MHFVNQLSKPLQASVASTKFHTRILSTLTFVQATGHGTAVPITAQEWNAAPLAAYQNFSLSQNLLSVWCHVRAVTIKSEDCDNHKKEMFLSYLPCLEIFDCGIRFKILFRTFCVHQLPICSSGEQKLLTRMEGPLLLIYLR